MSQGLPRITILSSKLNTFSGKTNTGFCPESHAASSCKDTLMYDFSGPLK